MGNAKSLATFDNYHLPRKNAIYHFVIFTDICGEEDFRCRG